MSFKLLTEQCLELLCLTGGCTSSSEATQVLSKCHIVGNHVSQLIIGHLSASGEPLQDCETN